MDRIYDWREAPEAEFAVIGDPIRHSLSPKMHIAAYGALGMDLRYVAIHVPEGEFRAARWVSFDRALANCVPFRQPVYRQLRHFARRL